MYFADGLPCGYGQEARRRIADGFVDRNEFRVTEAFEVEDLLRDLPIPRLFDRCLAVRDSVAQIYNDQNGVNLGFLRDAGIGDRNTFFQRVPALQSHVVHFLTTLLNLEEVVFSDKATVRAQQRLGWEGPAANKFVDEARALLKPYGCLPLDVGANLAGKKPNLKHELSPACLLLRLAPAGKRRASS
jgi:SAM-dependent methyltransferase